MPCYVVILEGRNFPGDAWGEPDKRYGFFTTRWVFARNPECAEHKAVAAVRKDEFIRAVAAARRDIEPRLTLESIREVPWLAFRRGSGASWYVEEAEVE